MGPNRRGVTRIRGAGIILILCALAQWGGPARAQNSVAGAIIGSVTDNSRAVLPGVTATITSVALPGGPQTFVTDEQGRYRFAGLPPGVYTLQLSLSGFAEYVEKDLRLVAGSTVERNVSMNVATVAETITVTGQSPVIETRSAALSTVATVEVVENLPTARTNINDFMQAMPGVAARNPGAYNEEVNVLGSPNTETLYIHDGTQIQLSGFSGGDIDAVEEVQTISIGVSAEFGAAAGGVMNMVTKSGTNFFRGDAQAYLKSDSFQSRPTLLSCSCPDGQTGFHMLDMQDVSFHLGGPIVRDRLWFFGGMYHFQFNYSEPGTYPQESPTNWWNRIGGKVTWQPTRSTRIFGTYKYEPWYGYANGPTRTVQLAAVGLYHDGTGGGLYTTEVNRTFGSSTVLLAHVGGVYGNMSRSSLTGDNTTPNHFDSFTGIESQGLAQISFSQYRREGQAVKLERYQSLKNVTHTLRTGLQHDRQKAYAKSSRVGGVNYTDFNGAPDTATLSRPSVNGGEWNRLGAWGEDQITLGRITVTAGLRFDHTVGTSPDVAEVDATLKPTGNTVQGLGEMFTWNTWSPRVGANVKLTDDGRTILRGTYSRVFREATTADVSDLHPGIATVTQARYVPETGTYSNIISVTNSRANLRLDPNYSAPQTDTYSIGVDRELMQGIGAHVSYVHKKSTNLTGWANLTGVFGEATTILPDGRSLTVYPLLSSPSAQIFQRTNDPRQYDQYDAVLLTVDRRLANRWRAGGNLTFSRSYGLRLTGTGGRDLNDYTNAEGRIKETDRPVMFTANMLYDVPKIDLKVSAQYQDLSNISNTPQTSVVLPQGRRNINIEPAGSFRDERVRLLNVRLNKDLFSAGARRVEVFANINNLFQNQAPQGIPTNGRQPYATFNYFAPNYAQPVAFIQPRHVFLGAKLLF